MSSGVSFGEVVAHAENVSTSALEVGSRFADAIPEPSVENGGLRAAAVWWARWVGKVVPLWDVSRPDDAKKARSDVLGFGWEADDIASDDVEQVNEWWLEAPMSNIGFASRANGVLIIDLDPRHGGLENFWKLCREHGIDVSNVPRSLSPRNDGGQHLWFRVPDGGTFVHSPLLPGVDRPWQVPVPPSLRLVTVDLGAKDPTRREAIMPYRWSAGDPRLLPVAPDILLGDGSPEAAQAAMGSAAGVVASAATGPIDVVGLARQGVPVGQQSYTFKRMACSMIAKGWDDDTITATLVATAMESPVGDPADPWTDGALRDMVRSARRFIDRSRAAEQAAMRAITANIPRSWS
jgi:hypothetical protein